MLVAADELRLGLEIMELGPTREVSEEATEVLMRILKNFRSWDRLIIQISKTSECEMSDSLTYDVYPGSSYSFPGSGMRR